MRTALLAVALFWGIAFALIYWSAYAPPELPHRAIDAYTNWGQGQSTIACPPGAIRMDTDEGLFLECFRTNAEN
jgi:hypothetical protein